jgi:hypothetical protein
VTAPQQFSPDGQWWWDGTQWIPAGQAPQQQAMPPQGSPAGWPPPVDPSTPAATPAAAPTPAAPPYQPYGQPYGYPTPPPYATAPPPSGNDGKAIGSLVASLVWVCGIGSIVAVILGHLSRSEARKQGRQPSGLALAGLVLGYLGILSSALIIAAVATHTDEIKDTFDSSLELQSAADAEHSYHDARGTYTEDLDALRGYGLINPNGSRNIDVVSATSTTFCLHAKVFGQDQYMTERSSSPSDTPCG